METNIPSKHSRRRGSHKVQFVSSKVDDGRASPPLEQEHGLKGNNSNNEEIDVSMVSDVKYCCYLLESMPLPGPTWSTTGPSVMAEPPSSAAQSIEASMGLEWGENQASSYTWWMGFLEGLDGNMAIEKQLDLPFVENNNVVMEHSKGLSHESRNVDAIANANDLGCCPDDWLITPTMEKDLGDIVVP